VAHDPPASTGDYWHDRPGRSGSWLYRDPGSGGGFPHGGIPITSHPGGRYLLGVLAAGSGALAPCRLSTRPVLWPVTWPPAGADSHRQLLGSMVGTAGALTSWPRRYGGAGWHGHH